MPMQPAATSFIFSASGQNTTTTQLAAGATFTGTIESTSSQQCISILLTCDQPGTLTIKQFVDAAGAFVISTWVIATQAGIPLSRNWTANGNYVQVAFKNNGGSTTTTLNLNTAYGTLPAVDDGGASPVSPGAAPAATTGTITTAVSVVGPVTMGTMDGLTVTVSGTYAGVNFGFWGSNDAALWVPIAAIRTDTGIAETTSGVLTANQTRAWDVSIGEFLYFRIVATAWTSGSAAIAIRSGMFAAESQVAAVGHGIYNTTLPTFTAGSLAYLLSDVNGRSVITGQVAAAAAIAGAPVRVGGTFTTTLPTYTTGQQTDLQTTARGEVLVALSNGATAVAVKAASTAAAATDPALTVSLSPNSPIVLPTPTSSIINSAATTNATLVKASAGTVYSVTASNTGAAAAFVKLYNLATAPTVGTSTVAITISVPAGGSTNLSFGTAGARFATGIGLAITNLGTDADTTAVAAAQVKVITAYI
jgi:hypothetical protein